MSCAIVTTCRTPSPVGVRTDDDDDNVEDYDAPIPHNGLQK